MSVVEDLIRGREAFERLDWAASHRALDREDVAALPTEDVLRLATAAYLLGRSNDAIRTLERAHDGLLSGGRAAGATRCTFWLALCHFTRGEMAEAMGWLERGDRLVDDHDVGPVEAAYLAIPRVIAAIGGGDFSGSIEMAGRIESTGRAADDPDLVAHGLHTRGRAQLYRGEVREGLAQMDEAMTWVTSGRLAPVFAGMIYCSTVEACQEVTDLARAEQWTSALSRWCDRQPDLVPFTGQCAVHRGQIMRQHGALADAVEEFGRAIERYTALGESRAAGLALYELGETHRWRGDLGAAETQFRAASGSGYEPQPGLALLRLQQSRPREALASVTRVLAEPMDVVHRSRYLGAAVEVLLAAAEREQAADVARELRVVADDFGSETLRAVADRARARVHLGNEVPASALPLLREAGRSFERLGAVGEHAVTRVELARALRGLGDEDSARMELEAARGTLQEMGARSLLHEVDGQLGDRARPGGLTDREVEVLLLVARGLSNPAIAAELVLSEKTVARHLNNIFTKLEVTSRTAATAFAYEHDLVRGRT